MLSLDASMMRKGKEDVSTGILGKKIGMTQVFDEKGEVHPVTVLQAGPCVITQLKTLAKDGYDAAQIGYVDFVKASKVNKPMPATSPRSNVPPVADAAKLPSKHPLPRRMARAERQSRPAIASWSTSSRMTSLST